MLSKNGSISYKRRLSIRNMKIIIAGAGDIGFHLAQLLALENQDITLIDTNADVLQQASIHLDVMTLKGDSSSIGILETAGANKAQLVIAATTSEKNNILTAMLAKRLGAKKAIARVESGEYLSANNKAAFKELGVDSLISPNELAAVEINRLINECTFTDIFEFEGGKIKLVGVTLNEQSPIINVPIQELDILGQEDSLMPIAILRGYKTIIPRGDTIMRRSDHVYFIVEQNHMERLEQIIDAPQVDVNHVMIIGGTHLGLTAAKRLEQDFKVTLIEKSKKRCREMAEQLDSTLIIHGDNSNIELLESEGLNEMDAFLALTDNSETNIIASLTAKNHGVYKTIAQVENKEYIHLSQNIGIDTLINRKLIAANNIFRYVRKGRIEAITSLHGVDAEVIEYVIHKNNHLTKHPLCNLHLPETSLIGGVIRGEKSIIPSGDFQLEKGDKVIVFALPQAITKLDKLFR